MKKIALTLTMFATALAAGAQEVGGQDAGGQEYYQQDAAAQDAAAQGAAAPRGPLDGSQFDTPAFNFDQFDNQGPRWQRGGVGGVTLSQVSLSNWAAGGEGSLALDALLNYDVLYTNRRHRWQNRLELAYGMNHSKSHKTRKTNDKIFLSSMYGYRLTRTWYASLLGTFSTQFAQGYDYNVNPKRYMSRFMAPGYLGFGAGFTWRPNTWFSAYISPATWRGTFMNDDRLFLDAQNAMTLHPYGVEPGKRMRHEFGANVRLEVNRDLLQDLHLYSRLDLFSNYLYKPQNVDVRWYALLAYRINDWLGVNFTFNLLYDDDIKFRRPDGTEGGSKIQIKEVLGIGLQTKF